MVAVKWLQAGTCNNSNVNIASGQMRYGRRRQNPRQCPKGIHFLFLGILIGVYIDRYRKLIDLFHDQAPNIRARALPKTNQELAPRKQSSILPKRLITVFGTESSGSTFLATTLGIATGAFPPNGTYVMTPSDRHNNSGRLIVERVVANRARTLDGEIEIQHLSLPWGFWGTKKRNCLMANKTIAVEAFVPEPCFRFDYESTWAHRLEVKAPAGCREEAHISGNMQNNSNSRISGNMQNNSNSRWTCGTNNCGTGQNDGYALYPRRFFVNITSHLQWYMQRGVDVTAVLSVRDKSISRAGKGRMHCSDENVGILDDKRATSIMSEALSKYGRQGRLGESRMSHASWNEERVIAVSYEALMGLKGPYLFDVYKTLGINSTYVPEFKDGNEKYVH